MNPDSSLHHRKNLRIPEFDYSQPGAYFVTIVAQDRKTLFGHIIDGEMILNDMGKMVEEVWIAIPKHFPNVKLGEFVIMPNHIHGIISITVEATHASPLQWLYVESTLGWYAFDFWVAVGANSARFAPSIMSPTVRMSLGRSAMYAI